MRFNRISLLCSAATGTLILALPVAPASAQSESGVAVVTADIIVTAQKREERLTDVPQSINVVTGQDIERFNLTNFSDIQKLVPGLDVSGGTVSLRGVKFNTLTLTRPTVDVYFNEVVSERAAQDFDLADVILRLDLRGPQGTLRAGTGPSGAILIASRRPLLDRADGYAMASYTDLDALNIQGAVSMPIVEGSLALRVAGLYEKGRGADIRNVVNGQRDRSRTSSGRASLTWQPNPDLRFDLVHQRLQSRGRSSAQVEGSGEFGTFSASDRASVADLAGRVETDTQITTLNAVWDFAGHRLSYTGGHSKARFGTTSDSDSGNALLTTPFGRIPIALYTDTISDQRDWTHEARIERTGDNFWNYRLGIFRRSVEQNVNVLIDFTGANGDCRTTPGPLAAFGLPCTFVDTSGSPSQIEMGYFMTHTLNLSPHDKVEVGVRRAVTDSAKAWTGSASYTHKFNENLTAYANWGRAFRPGGDEEYLVLSNPQIPATEFGYDAETSNSFEVGFKGLFFDEKLSIAAAVFYQKFNGYISNVQGIVCTGNPAGVGLIPGTVFATQDGLPPNGTNPCGTGSLGPTFNGDASARGVEFDARLAMAKGWMSQLTVSYANAHFDDAEIPCNDFNGDGEADSQGIPAVQAGRYFSRCTSRASLGGLPKWQVSANTEYTAALSGGLDGFVRLLADYSPAAREPADGRRVPSSFQIDMFAGLRLDKANASIELFARNLLNERKRMPGGGEIYSLFGAPTGYFPVSIGRGREVGVLGRVSF